MYLPTKARLGLLLGFVLAALAAMLGSLKWMEHERLDDLVRERIGQTESVFNKIVRLKDRGFRVHASDYTRWDEFVAFVRKPDPTWARLNIRESIPDFGVDIAWVLDSRLRTVYAIRADDRAAHRELPVSAARLRARLVENPFRHFFAYTGEGLLELWTAPIQPSADLQRKTPPAGFYVIGRFWRPQVLEDLADVAGGRVTVLRGPAAFTPRPADPVIGTIEAREPLPDLDGSPIAALWFQTQFPVAQKLDRDARRTLWLMATGAVAVLLVAFFFLWAWVARPLERIERALKAESAAPLGRLPRGGDEFGRMARLIAEFFEQREKLVTEVADRRTAERQIAVQRNYVRQVIDTDPNLIYVVDSGGRVVLANQAAAVLFGAVPEALLGREIQDVLGPLGLTESFASSSARALEKQATEEIEESCVLTDGRARRYQSIRCPLHRAVETQVLTISVDVTERVRQQRELTAAKEAAEEAGRTKSQFLANVSHELRTPMHGILSYTRFGQREWETAERAELLDYFENIHECGSSLLALLNDLLDLSRLESGRMNFAFQPLDIAEVVETAAVEFEPLFEERGVRLDVIESPGLPAVRGDRMKLLQVLRNLLSNAGKFTPTGKGIEVATEWDDARVRLAIRDEGIGIPEGELETIFDKFVQSSKNKSGGGGTGLGLAICREILGAHGGRIWAENRPGGGTVLTLEVVRADAAGLEEPGCEPEEVSHSHESKAA